MNTYKTALKDWKLISRNAGRHGNVREYMNTKTEQFITIPKWWLPKRGNVYVVMHREGKAELDDDKIITEKIFKTQKQAIKFSKSIMRKH